MPFNIVNHYAVIFDDEGTALALKKINIKEKSFNYKSLSYIIDVEKSSFFKVPFILVFKKYYFYNIGNPEPIKFFNQKTSLFNSKEYNMLVETDVLIKLNNLSKNWLSKLLENPWLILLIIFVIGVIYYFYTKDPQPVQNTVLIPK